MTFLYHLCIEPLESLMRLVLEHAYALTGSWGFSLVLLSLVVNIALIPFYHLAESWQEDERTMQKRMAAKLAEIKSVYKGRERYMYVRALHRLHGYSPIFSLRTSCGLLIQIPFFFAAFQLLHTAPELSGSTVWFIKDLSLPDGLLSFGEHTVNILPFVMTGINLLSAAVYTTRLSRQEKIQLYGLAGLFLLLLYTSSAALLLYWTCNNIFSLCKNIIYCRWIYKKHADACEKPQTCDEKNAGSDVTHTSIKNASSTPSYVQHADIIFGALSVLAFVGGVILQKKTGASLPAISVMGVACIFGIVAIICRTRALCSKVTIERALPAFFFLMTGITVLVVWHVTSYKKVSSMNGWMYFRLFALAIGLMTGWVLSRQPLYPLIKKAADGCLTHIPRALVPALFGFGVLLTAILVFLYSPSGLYASDPDFFYESPSELAARLVLRALIFCGFATAIYRISPLRIRPFFAAASLWLGIATLLYTFVATGDYGTMDGFLLQNPALLKSRLSALVDAFVCLGATFLVYLIFVKQKASACVTLLQGLCLILGSLSIYQIASAPITEAALHQTTHQLPEYNDRLLGFSATEDNVVIIMFDMFTGSHVQDILDDTPELRTQLDGFTWYPDTVAPGAATLLSIASIMGGEEYTVPNINKRAPDDLLDEIHKGFATLPNIFIPQGYDVALADVDELIPDRFATTCANADKTLLVGKSLRNAYTGYWREQNGIASPLPETQAPFLASFGMFSAAPWVLRQHIYFNGTWMGTQTLSQNPSEGPMAMLHLMPEVSNAAAQGKTLKYIGSQVSHYPWRLDPATCMPLAENTRTSLKNGSIKEHIDAERCALKGVARWIAWMKEAGVYDNTQIILVSDHDGNDSPRTYKKFDSIRTPDVPWKPDALLLVKNTNERGTLKTDTAAMSSADVLPLICAEIAAKAGTVLCPSTVAGDPRILENRIRTHSSGLASIRRHKKGRFITRDYTIRGNFSEPKNWEEKTK